MIWQFAKRHNPTMSGINDRLWNLFVGGLAFYNHSILKGSLIWRKKRWKFLKLQRKKTFTSVFWNKHRSSLLTSKGLLWILTKTNNQSNEKIVDIMSYKTYTHTHLHTHTHTHTQTHTHTHIHMYVYHFFISLSKPTSVSV